MQNENFLPHAVWPTQSLLLFLQKQETMLALEVISELTLFHPFLSSFPGNFLQGSHSCRFEVGRSFSFKVHYFLPEIKKEYSEDL